MGYQALYRVWRPQRFSDLVGQELITQTLKNAIAAKQTSHAYLFAGPRGTGKTSAAKIFAKAINCHQQKNGEPCNQCATCQAITQGRLNDVIEIDAASNNSVDEVRDIREKVKYAPTQADYKVYIIDEVHMLSTGAFNALLKTLEEPPANVIFILATTEPYKIPATIISRTQRFDFHRISDPVLIKRMEYILQQEKFSYEPEALKIIAKAAAGGMRDALSMLDQVLSFGNNQATQKAALLVTGSVAQNQLHDYLTAVFAQQPAKAFGLLQQLMDAGKDANQLFENLIDYCRQILLQQSVYQKQPAKTDTAAVQLAELANQVSPQVIYQALDILSEQQQAMRFATRQDVYLDVATIKLCQLNKTIANSSVSQTDVAVKQTISNLKKEVTQLSEQLAAIKQQPATVGTQAPSNASHPVGKKKAHLKVQLDLKAIYEVLDSASRKNLDELKDLWPDLLAKLSVTQRAVMNVSQPVAASQNAAVVSFQYSFLYEKAAQNQDLQAKLAADLKLLAGRQIKLTFLPQEQWPQIRQNYLKEFHGQKTATTKKVPRETPPSKTKTADPQLVAAEKIWGAAADKLIKFKDD